MTAIGLDSSEGASRRPLLDPGAAESLGTPIETVLITGSAIGRWPDGRPVLATVGGPADQPVEYAVLDLRDGSLLSSHRIANSQRSYHLTVTDDAVLIASWGGGNLFRHDLTTDRLTDLGMMLPGQTLLATTVLAPHGHGDPGEVAADDTRSDPAESDLYGGTYPDGRLFRLPGAATERDEAVVDLGQVDPREDMVRSLAWDDGRLYVGTEAHGRLHRIDLDPATGQQRTRTEILMPAATADDNSVDDLAVRNGLLFVHSSPSQSWHVLQLSGHRWLGRVPGRFGRGISAVDDAGWVHLVGDDGLHRHHVRDHVTERIWADAPASTIGVHRCPYGIVGITPEGTLWCWDPGTGEGTRRATGLPATGVTIRALGASESGRVLVGGSLAPTTYAEWDPTSEQLVRFSGGPGSRVDAFASIAGRTYLSQYPSGAVFEYDPDRAYEGPPHNPWQLLSLAESHQQERVFALQPCERDLFIGSTGARGIADGRLLRWSTTDQQLVDLGNPVPGHSVVSLALAGSARGGRQLVGGTSVQVLGAQASDTEAKLFVADPATGRTSWTGTPQPGALSISALVADTTRPDEATQVWGLTTNGFVFRLDTGTRTFHDLAKVGPEGGIWGMGSLHLHGSRHGRTHGSTHGLMLYGATPSGTVFAFHPGSHRVTYLGLGEHAVIVDDWLYWTHGSELVRLRLPTDHH